MNIRQLTKNFDFIDELIQCMENVQNSETKILNYLKQAKDILINVESILDNETNSLNINNICIEARKCTEIIFKGIFSKNELEANEQFSVKQIILDFFNRYSEKNINNSIKFYILHIVEKGNHAAHANTTKMDLSDTLYSVKCLYILFKWYVEFSGYKKVYDIEISDFDPSVYNVFSNSGNKSIVTEKEKELDKKISNNFFDDIYVEKISICNLLLYEESRNFIIPVYQRGYSWEIQNIEDLFNDIESRSKDNNIHYFGVVACKNSKATNKIKLIDGQQRLTTSLILSKIIREIAKENADKFHNDEFKWFFDEKIDSRITNIFYNPTGDSATNDLFKDILFKKYDYLKEHYEKSKSKIYRNYKWMYERVKEKADRELENDDDFSFTKFYKSFITRFDVAIVQFNEETITNKQELEIFENFNSKGKTLENADLIKNYLINLCSEEFLNLDSIDNTITYNREIVSEIDADKINNFFEYLINYYINEETTFKDSRKTLKNFSKTMDIFFEEKKLGEPKDIDEKTFDKVLKILNKYIKIFNVQLKLFENLDNISTLLNVINSSKRKLYYPIAFLIVEFAIAKNYTSREIELFIKNNKTRIFSIYFLVSKFIIADFVINGKGDSSTKRLMYDVAYNIRKEILTKKIKDENDFLKLIYNELLDKLFYTHSKYKNNKEFFDDFKQGINSIQLNEEWVLKAILLLVDYNSLGISEGNIGHSGKIELEHIMPKKWDEYWVNDMRKWNNETNDEILAEKHSENLNKLGNLMILSKIKNSKIQNKPFSEKIRSYDNLLSCLFRNNKNDAYQMGFSDKSQWSFNDIKERDKKIRDYIIFELYKDEFKK